MIIKQLASGTYSLSSAPLQLQSIDVPAYGKLAGLLLDVTATVTLASGDAIRTGVKSVNLFQEVKLKQGQINVFDCFPITTTFQELEVMNYLASIKRFGANAQRQVYKTLASGTNSDKIYIWLSHSPFNRKLDIVLAPLSTVFSTLTTSTCSVTLTVYGLYDNTIIPTDWIFEGFAITSITTGRTSYAKQFPEGKVISDLAIAMDQDAIDTIYFRPSQEFEESIIKGHELITLEMLITESAMSYDGTNATLSSHQTGLYLFAPPFDGFVYNPFLEFDMILSTAPSFLKFYYFRK